MALGICCQQFGKFMSVEDFFGIEDINPWRINVGFRVPVSPLGAGLGNIQLKEYLSVEYIHGIDW